MDHPFDGRCIVSINGQDSFVWEFIQTGVLSVRNDKDITFGGTLIEYYENDSPKETQYTYNTAEKCLYIDRSIWENGICRFFYYRYRIEQIDENDWNIYYTENMDNEPSDYGYRMKIRRANPQESEFTHDDY